MQAPETDPPSFPGVTFRRFRGPEDFAPMASAITRSREADGVEFATTVEDLAADYEHPLDFDPATDVLVAEVRGTIVGLARMWHDERADGTRAYRHSVEIVPEARGGGLRDALFDYNERRARTLAAPHVKERPRVLVLWANDGENEWKALVLRRGYTPVRHEIEMVRPLDAIPDFRLPAGIKVRPAAPEDVRAVWDAVQVGEREAWDFAEASVDDDHLEAFRRSPRFQPGLWQLAWDADTLVGMVLPFILEDEIRRYGHRRGHTESVYVREGYRGRGIARALLARSLRALKERGMEEATLSTSVENPHAAFRIYEAMGFRVVKRFTWYQKPF